MRFDDFKHDITFEHLLDLIDRRGNFDDESTMYVEWAEHFFSSLADSLEKILNPRNEGRYCSLEPNIIKLIENKTNKRGIISCMDLNELKNDLNYLSLNLKNLKENPLEFYKNGESKKVSECILKHIPEKNNFKNNFNI